MGRDALRFVTDSNDVHGVVDDRADPVVSRILLVLVPVYVDDPIVCPLCLDAPVAPRIASCCSQCYCLACVVRLHQYQQEAFTRSCPVCHSEHVQFAPARIEQKSRVLLGSVVDFELVVRIKGNACFAVPVHDHWKLHMGQAASVLMALSDPLARFCRFVYADRPADLALDEVREIEGHIGALKRSQSGADLEMLPAWTTALELSRARLAELQRLVTATLPVSAPALNYDTVPSPAPDRLVFYYQSAEGQYVFADSLVQRMLLHDRACAVEDLPRRLSLKVMALEANKRFGFLSHLIDEGAAEWWVADCAVTMVSAATMATFSGEIRKRKDARKREAARKAQSDRRHEQRVRQEAARREKSQASSPERFFVSPDQPQSPPVVSPAPMQDTGLFLSYAAIASADGASFGPSSRTASPVVVSSPVTSATSPPSKPSFADLVKGQVPQSPPAAAVEEIPAHEKSKRGKKFVVLQAAGGGARRMK